MSVASGVEPKPTPHLTPETKLVGSHEVDQTQYRDRPVLSLRLLCLSVVPFLVIPVAHLLSDPQTVTGLFH